MDLGKEILKAIQIMVNKKFKDYKADRTYKTVITEITSKGYIVLDNSGSKRTVKCCIPGLKLKIGQSIWVKEPMGQLGDMHICGVVLK